MTALCRAGWAGELLNPTEKMLCSCSPKEGSQASMAALNTSYSCTTAPHKTRDQSPVTVLCSISVCPSLGLGSAPSIKAWQGLQGGGNTQLSWKTLRTVHLNSSITTSFTPLHFKYKGTFSDTLKLVDSSSASKTYACTRGPNPISSQ